MINFTKYKYTKITFFNNKVSEFIISFDIYKVSDQFQAKK